ncbi:MAG TPA: hypothetical protein VHE37_00790, partial [Nevskiaceae bacterium]|nr:hypothetical protein [Nevskiaceae bacterium]
MSVAKSSAILAMTCVLLLAGGCNRDATDKNAADVQKAEEAGARKVEQAQVDASRNVAGANKDVQNAQNELAHETAEGREHVALAEA